MSSCTDTNDTPVAASEIVLPAHVSASVFQRFPWLVVEVFLPNVVPIDDEASAAIVAEVTVRLPALAEPYMVFRRSGGLERLHERAQHQSQRGAYKGQQEKRSSSSQGLYGSLWVAQR